MNPRASTSADSQLSSARQGGVHRAIIGRGSLYTVATIAPVLVSVAVTPVLTRTLGAQEYGLVALAITFYQLVSMLIALGLPLAITRNAIVDAAGPRGASALVVIGACGALGFGTIIAVLTPFWAPMLVGGASANALVPPAISAVGIALVVLAQALLRALDRAVEFVTFAAMASIIPAVLGVAAIWALSPDAEVYLWALAVGHLVIGLTAVVRVTSSVRPRWAGLNLRFAFRMALPTLPHQLSSPFLAAGLVGVATYLHGVATGGQVQLALLLGTAPMIVLSAVNNSWSPLVMRAGTEQRPQVSRDAAALVATLTLVMSAGFVALIGPMSMLLAGPQLATQNLVYAASTAAVGATFMVVYLANIQLVFLVGKTGMLGITSPIAAVASVVAAAVFGLAVDGDLRVFTAGASLNWLLMSLISFWLRRRTGEPRVQFGPALPYLAAGATLTVIWALVPVPSWVGCVVLAIVVLATGFLQIRGMRRQHQ